MPAYPPDSQTHPRRLVVPGALRNACVPGVVRDTPLIAGDVFGFLPEQIAEVERAGYAEYVIQPLRDRLAVTYSFGQTSRSRPSRAADPTGFPIVCSPGPVSKE